MVSWLWVSGCGPEAADAVDCEAFDETEVVFPDGLGEDLQAAAVAHAQERLEAYILPPQRGFAFRGEFTLDHHDRTTVGAQAYGLLIQSGPSSTFEMCEHDGGCLRLQYNFDGEGSITVTGRRPPCPASVATPRPAEPFSVPMTLCRAEPRDGVDATFSVTAEPIAADELNFDDILSLNDLPARRYATANADTLERTGGVATLRDLSTYRDGPHEPSALFIDYEATWQIDTDCLGRFALERVDIHHVEVCDFTGDHWHGRYDVPCRVIATVAGRPDWASSY